MTFCIKKRIVKISTVFLFLGLLSSFCSSCRSAKDQYIDELSAFTDRICTSAGTCTPEEWSIIAEQYQAFREEGNIYHYEFTASDRMQVDSCYRILNATIAKGYIESGAERLKATVEEAVHLFEDLLQ